MHLQLLGQFNAVTGSRRPTLPKLIHSFFGNLVHLHDLIILLNHATDVILVIPQKPVRYGPVVPHLPGLVIILRQQLPPNKMTQLDHVGHLRMVYEGDGVAVGALSGCTTASMQEDLVGRWVVEMDYVVHFGDVQAAGC